MANQTLSSNLIKGIVSTEKAKTEQTPILDNTLKNDDSQLLKNIIAQDESKKSKVKAESSLLVPTVEKKSALLILLKLLFALVCMAAIASVLFFTSQLTNAFDFVTKTTGKEVPNLSKDVGIQAENIFQKQTDFNFYRFLQAKMYVDQISYHGDSFMKNYEIFNSKTASSSERKKAKDDMVPLKENLSVAFAAAKDKLSAPMYQDITSLDYKSANEVTKTQQIESAFKESLVNKFNTTIAGIQNSSNTNDKADYKNYTYALMLVNNPQLQNLIKTTNFAEISGDDKAVYDLVKQINSLVVNDFSVIQHIKEGRIKWSDVINEIDHRTSQVDTYYSKDFYESYGGIRYSSYDFDSDAGKISISGETKRFDAKNFTMIASLIEELNNSDLFSGAEMRSFTKSGTTDDGYTATIQIVTYLKEALENLQAETVVENEYYEEEPPLE